MVVWINGPFGIGKTTTARAFRRLARDSGLPARIFDPEMIGFVLQRTIPRALRPPDFRDQRSWNAATRWIVQRATGLTIIPMTISRPEQLAHLAIRARIFQLTAPRGEIRRRIRQRDHGVEWALRHLDTWPDDDRLGERVSTQDQRPEEVARRLLRLTRARSKLGHD